MNRIVFNPKRPFRSEDLSIILIHSERRRGKAHSLIRVENNQLLINKQIAELKKTFGNNVDIVLILGYECDNIIASLIDRVRIVEDESFDQSDFGKSVLIGIRASVTKAVYVINGCLNFNEKLFFAQMNSHVLVGSENEESVGLAISDNKVVGFNYGLENRFGDLMYLCEDDCKRYLRCYKKNLLFHEIMNDVVDEGAHIVPLYK